MKALLATIALLASQTAFGCDTTLNSGADLHSAVITYAGKDICLNPGTYNLGSSTLTLPAGTSIEGISSDRNDIVLNSTAIRGIRPGDGTQLKNFLLNGPGGASSEFGILTYGNTGVRIWSLRVQNFDINIGVHTSAEIDIWDTFTRLSGDAMDSYPSPNIWIYSSDDVSIAYGEARGRANGPGGDGEVAAHDSTEVHIDGMYTVDIGASALYMVNCDGCSIRNTINHRPGEWGLDIVSGSDYFEASNNTVLNANFGGAVFDEQGSAGGSFTNNTFQDNRLLGVGNCNGINVIGTISGVSQSGNTSNPPGTICTY